MSGQIVVEISVESLERAVAAERGEASRIELCASLEIGGVTPSAELMRAVRARVSLPIFVMVRPRGGDFIYSAAEFREMRASIETAREAGMDGVVSGLLRSGGTVDVERTAELVRVAAPLPVTFHRAIDASADLFAALEDVVATGAARVLTSAGADKAPEVVARIAEMVRRARGRIVILPGSGITPENVGGIVSGSGAREVHAGLSSVVGWDAGADIFEAEVKRLVQAAG